MTKNNNIPTINRPCIRKCNLDENEICLGCFRTFDDMRSWHRSSLEEKLNMLSLANKRKERHKNGSLTVFCDEKI